MQWMRWGLVIGGVIGLCLGLGVTLLQPRDHAPCGPDLAMIGRACPQP